MRKMMKGIAAVLAVSALMAGTALAADKLKVQDSTGNNTVFKVDDAGAGIQVNDTSGVGKAVITGQGFLGLGVTSPFVAVHAKGNSSYQTQLLLTRQDANASGGAGFIGYHNNITAASCTANGVPSACCTGPGQGITCPTTTLPANNDRLGYFLFGGYGSDGTTPKNSAGMVSRTEAAWTDTIFPAYFAFETISTTGGSRTERFRISANGNIVTGNNAGAATANMLVGATDGYLYIPVIAGQPTGTPSSYTGHAPIAVDAAGTKLWLYIGGAWKSATLN